MKKTVVLIIFVMATTLFAGILQAENVNWNVSSDDTCRTYFHVGEHTSTVVIMNHRVNNDLSLRDGYSWHEVYTLNASQHYEDSNQCPNFRYIYKLVDAITGDLVSTEVFQVKGNESSNGWCSECMPIDVEKE
ncbi:MAG: hypothetical protein GY757_10275 [bacterium]|nr:hypothetical protein [bacterium]